MSLDDLTGRMIGPYQLERLLGTGAMGAVYRAHQSNLSRDVALKVLPSALAARPDYMARFTREAKIAASLEHPHIVPVYDYGTADGISYVVMRLLGGGTLAERLNQRAINREPVPSLSETAHLLRQMASALDYAQRKGVVHRDIKPNNIMFDDEGAAYLVDFGIAKLMNVTTSITGEQTVFGTPHYMPPEQWRDQTLTPESDQYALAVVVYSMVTGQPPFDAPTPHALMYKHFHEAVPPLSSLRPDLPEALDSVLSRALEKTPEARYETVGAFAQAFDRAIADVPAAPTGFFTFELSTGARVAPPVLAVAPERREPPAPAVVPERPEAPVTLKAAPAPVAPPAPVARPVQIPVPPRAAAPVQPAAALAGPPRKAAREPKVPPLLAGAGVGLALLGLVVCGGAALVASQLGLFEREAVPTQPVEMSTNAPVVLTQLSPTEMEAGPTDLPLPGSTLPPGTAIAVADAGSLSQSASLAHGTEPVRGVAFRPDGSTVATGAAGGGIFLWGLDGSVRSQIASGGSVIYGLSYSPDGALLASAHEDGTVRLWNAETMSAVEVLRGHSGPVRGIAFSPDGRRLASSGEDFSVRVWDVATRTPVRQFDDLGARALAVAFSADGTRVAAASDGGIARVWNVESGASVATLSGGGQLRSIAWSPDGQQIATGGADGSLRLWNAETGTLEATMSGHSGEVWAVAFSPDGRLLLTGGRDQTARLWDVASEQQLTVLRGHAGWVLAVAFNQDGSRIITGSGDGTARLWETTAG